MHPLSNAPERVVKKVSRACNTCRLKRKKCDGLDPCAFCIDNKLECLYSKEPRRRGPPSGYLRYMETRVAMLEILLGLYLSKYTKSKDDTQGPCDPFLDIAKTLKAEAKTCTQDVWDGHKAFWTNTESEVMIEELVVSFAPFTPRPPQEVAVKTLLPSTTTSSSTTHDKQQQQQQSSASTSNTKKSNAKQRTSAIAQMPKLEPFERAGTRESVLRSTSSPVPQKGQLADPMEDRDDWQTVQDPTHNTFMDMQDPSTANPLSLTHPIYRSQAPFDTSTIQMANADNLGMALGMDINDEYTGSYWRTVDLTLPEHDAYTPLPVTQNDHFVQAITTNPIELPPIHILSRLLDVFYQYSYSSYPLLPSRPIFDALLASPSRSDLFSTLVLSICAYSGRLSPSSHTTTASDFGFLLGAGGLAGKIAADLWYEQARTALSTLLKKGSSLELVQVCLILALRDYGKGNESQAWVLVGVAVRMAQDLELDKEVNNNNANVMERMPEERQLRRNVWGVCVILDLLLSLQMGRPPANSEPLKITVESSSSSSSHNTSNANSNSNSNLGSRPPDIDVNPLPPFAYRVSLCRVISLIHYHLYLGYDSPVNQLSNEKFSRLRRELDIWHHSLPMQYRIAIGHQPRSDVLEINMLYHVAIILLYRPISSEQMNQQATDIFLEAASTFNVLLEKYRQSQSQLTSSISTSISTPNSNSTINNNNPSQIYHTNPNMIYLIYTVAIAHLSGYKTRQMYQGQGQGQGPGNSGSGPGSGPGSGNINNNNNSNNSNPNSNSLSASSTSTSTSALQIQLHLLKCLEALASIGFTWEMARRCWKSLDSFMEMENLKPRGSVSGINGSIGVGGGGGGGEMIMSDDNQVFNASFGGGGTGTLGKRKREFGLGLGFGENQRRDWGVPVSVSNVDMSLGMSGNRLNPHHHAHAHTHTHQHTPTRTHTRETSVASSSVSAPDSYQHSHTHSHSHSQSIGNLTATVMGSNLSSSPVNVLDGTGAGSEFTSNSTSIWDPTTTFSTNPNPNSSGTGGESGTGGSSSTYFDPSLFSTKWMPDASEAYNIDWDHTWEEASQWSETFMSGTR